MALFKQVGLVTADASNSGDNIKHNQKEPQSPVGTHLVRNRKPPFRKLFGRSKSHHIFHPAGACAIQVVGAIDEVAGSTVPSRVDRSKGPPFHNVRLNTGLPSLALHNSNPFVNGNRKPSVESPFSVLGTGNDVSSPRSFALPTRNTAQNMNGNRICTPSLSAQSSRSIGYYQTGGGDRQEKLLPLPVRNPNDKLPPHLKQPSVLLTDNFSFPTIADGEKRVIGEGGSSQVVTVVSNYRRSQVYALKQFKMFSYEEADEFYDRCIREYLLAKKLDGHINIIKTFYIVKVPSSATNSIKRSWAFVMQHCVQDVYFLTTLSGWANKSFEEKWCCFKQIARGVKYMHNLGIAHRDIKLENVLATDYGALKIIDFGVSTYAVDNPEDPNSPRIRLKGYCGSPPYTSPEVMILSSEKRRKYDVPKDKSDYDPFAMDMWALGIVLYTLIIPSLPFLEAHKDDPRYRQFIMFYDQFCLYNTNFRKPNTHKQGPGAEHPEFSKFQSTDATRVCMRLLDPDPDTRYTMDDLFNDPWFQAIETCLDEGTDEPVKVPELKKTTEGSDSPYAHNIPPSDEENVLSINGSTAPTHCSNPFLNNNTLNFTTLTNVRLASGPRSLINIAEDASAATSNTSGLPYQQSQSHQQHAAAELPTLSEEDVCAHTHVLTTSTTASPNTNSSNTTSLKDHDTSQGVLRVSKEGNNPKSDTSNDTNKESESFFPDHTVKKEDNFLHHTSCPFFIPESNPTTNYTNHPSTTAAKSDNPFSSNPVPTKKIIPPFLNESFSSPLPSLEHSSLPIFSSDPNNPHSISRSSSIVSRNSAVTPTGGFNSCGGSFVSILRTKKKKLIHRHHECSGKPLLNSK